MFGNRFDITDEIQKLCSKLRPAHMGEQAAKDGEPRSDATMPGADEHTIIDAGRALLHRVSDWFSERIAAIQQACNENVLTTPLGESLSAAKTAFELALTSSQDTLCRLHGDVGSAYDERERFKEKYGLERTPRNHNDRGPKIAVLLIVLIMESVFNATMFASGSALGFVGGLMEAAFVAGASLIFSAAAGCGSRYMGDPRRRNRPVAGLAMLVYGALILVFHMGVAHYRTSLVLALPDPSREAVIRLITATFDIDFKSWMLFLVGLIFAGIAFIKGRVLDDETPRFGALGRRFEKARNKWEAAHQAWRDEIAAIVAERQDELKAAYNAKCATFRAYTEALREADALKRAYPEDCAKIARATLQNIRSYREANRAMRTADAPAYFDEPLDVPFTPDESLLAQLDALCVAYERLDPERELEALKDEMIRHNSDLNDHAKSYFDFDFSPQTKSETW